MRHVEWLAGVVALVLGGAGAGAGCSQTKAGTAGSGAGGGTTSSTGTGTGTSTGTSSGTSGTSSGTGGGDAGPPKTCPTDPTAASVTGADLEGCGVFVSAPAADGGAADGGGGGGDGTFGNPFTTLAAAAAAHRDRQSHADLRVRRGLHDHDHGPVHRQREHLRRIYRLRGHVDVGRHRVAGHVDRPRGSACNRARGRGDQRDDEPERHRARRIGSGRVVDRGGGQRRIARHAEWVGDGRGCHGWDCRHVASPTIPRSTVSRASTASTLATPGLARGRRRADHDVLHRRHLDGWQWWQRWRRERPRRCPPRGAGRPGLRCLPWELPAAAPPARGRDREHRRSPCVPLASSAPTAPRAPRGPVAPGSGRSPPRATRAPTARSV